MGRDLELDLELEDDCLLIKVSNQIQDIWQPNMKKRLFKSNTYIGDCWTTGSCSTLAAWNGVQHSLIMQIMKVMLADGDVECWRLFQQCDIIPDLGSPLHCQLHRNCNKDTEIILGINRWIQINHTNQSIFISCNNPLGFSKQKRP